MYTEKIQKLENEILELKKYIKNVGNISTDIYYFIIMPPWKGGVSL